MIEDTNQDENAEVVAPETSENEAVQATSSRDKNWEEVRAMLHENKLRDQQHEREKEELRRELQELRTPQTDEVDELSNDDIITVGAAKKMFERTSAETARKVYQEMEKAGQEEKVRLKYPDYELVIEKYAAPAIKKTPALGRAILSAENPYLAAYEFGKMQKVTVDPNETAKRIEKNAEKPVSSHAATPSGALSHASSFQKMSKDEVWKLSQKYAQGLN